MQTYFVRYVAGCYNGVRRVEAEDEERAVAIVRSRIRREMTLPMYSEGYRVLSDAEIERSINER